MAYGICVVIYDKAGDYYYLIVKRTDGIWELPNLRFEDKPADEVERLTQLLDTFLGQYKIAHRFEENHSYPLTVYVGDSATNAPVTLPSTHENYLWTKADSVFEKLTDEDQRKIFSKVHDILSS